MVLVLVKIFFENSAESGRASQLGCWAGGVPHVLAPTLLHLKPHRNDTREIRLNFSLKGVDM